MRHPQPRALLDFIEQRGVPPTHTLTVADARAYYRERRHVAQPVQPVPPDVAAVCKLACLVSFPHAKGRCRRAGFGDHRNRPVVDEFVAKVSQARLRSVRRCYVQ